MNKNTINPFPDGTGTSANYSPRIIAQRADYNFGETVTHEDYNARFNLIADSLDYYAEIITSLFQEEDSTKAYHIPYLDKALITMANETNAVINELDTKYAGYEARIAANENNIADNLAYITRVDNNLSSNVSRIDGRLDNHDNTLNSILNGPLSVFSANKINGVDNAGPYTYYGTDKQGSIGFHGIPPAIYADDIGEHEAVNPVDVDGIYYVPGSNSVAESMLTPALREKINDVGITSYAELSNLPSIAGVTLIANKTLADLGIQPAGNYLTSVPDTYATKAWVQDRGYLTSVPEGYATEEWVQNRGYLTSVPSGYATEDWVRSQGYLTSVPSSYATQSYVTSRGYNRIGIGSYPSNPIAGDMYVSV